MSFPYLWINICLDLFEHKEPFEVCNGDKNPSTHSMHALFFDTSIALRIIDHSTSTYILPTELSIVISDNILS